MLLLWSMIWGVTLGVIHSAVYVRRAAGDRFGCPKLLAAILLHIEDFLLCVTGAAGLSVLYFATVLGVLRLMALPAVLGGFLLWRRTGGRMIEALTDQILSWMERLTKLIVRRLLSPIGRWLKKRWDHLCRRVHTVTQKAYLRYLTHSAQRVTRRYLYPQKLGRLPSPYKNLRKRGTKNE